MIMLRVFIMRQLPWTIKWYQTYIALEYHGSLFLLLPFTFDIEAELVFIVILIILLVVWRWARRIFIVVFFGIKPVTDPFIICALLVQVNIFTL